MTHRGIGACIVGAFALCGAVAFPINSARAQNTSAADGQGLEEIVVTATRRETNLEKTPISISVLAAADIEKNHVVDLTDVTRLTPSLVYMPRGGSEGYLSLRGALIFDDSPGTDPAVSMYIDDVVRVSVADVQPDVYDIDRVEVLKGPQGTLFGRNSIGGVVSMYTNQPTFKNGGTAEVTYGKNNLVELKGVYNAALIDNKLAARIVLSDSSVDGNVRDITTGGELNGEHQFSARGKLLFTPTDDFKLVSSFDYLHKQGTQAEWLLGNYQPALVPGLTYDPERTAQGKPGEDGQTNWGLTERVDWTMGLGTFTSITGYRHLNSSNTKTLFPVDALILNAYEHDNQVTQELRLPGLSAGLGVRAQSRRFPTANSLSECSGSAHDECCTVCRRCIQPDRQTKGGCRRQIHLARKIRKRVPQFHRRSHTRIGPSCRPERFLDRVHAGRDAHLSGDKRVDDLRHRVTRISERRLQRQ